jgi:hypothetical protein
VGEHGVIGQYELDGATSTGDVVDVVGEQVDASGGARPAWSAQLPAADAETSAIAIVQGS